MKTKHTFAKLQDKSIPRLSPDAVFRKNTDGSVAVLRLDVSEYYFTIDKVAAATWLLIDGRRNISDIVGSLVKKKEITDPQLAKYVRRFVSTLGNEKLVWW